MKKMLEVTLEKIKQEIKQEGKQGIGPKVAFLSKSSMDSFECTSSLNLRMYECPPLAGE
jgi:hypothetical protein